VLVYVCYVLCQPKYKQAYTHHNAYYNACSTGRNEILTETNIRLRFNTEVKIGRNQFGTKFNTQYGTIVIVMINCNYNLCVVFAMAAFGNKYSIIFHGGHPSKY